ncbi:MAG TPA: hypothetical protein DCR43_06625 [Bacteroidales bacterium]|nr:MAG: hypothetical protein A2X11_16100 [Bacteroidetes bacterium GWE2_42_24]OFY29206.1 MAG: hypothetical protein A2X09_05735 [Bacteroidetes bacterium GWF2_43_11]PKP23454.1 MAG: hypothetical protein CVU06_08200 [Bacteroidetes bacterium HGW-Bacteroidetes-22]HAQ65509.1 hypothetical protein [Bacteroidales bacterium]HBZ66811.1 hypothetical protein [Bacteroidales bacterium]
MKKIYVLMLLCAIGLTVSAQKYWYPKFGITSATLTYGDDNVSKSSVSGLVGGIGYYSGDFLALNSEFLYIQKGAKVESGEDYMQLKTGYLEIPLMLRLTIGPDAFKVFAVAGGYAAFWLHGTQESKISGEIVSESYEFSDVDNRFDFGLTFGAGGMINLGKGNLMAEIRYDMGLSDIVKWPDGEPDGWKSVKNHCLYVTLGFVMPID